MRMVKSARPALLDHQAQEDYPVSVFDLKNKRSSIKPNGGENVLFKSISYLQAYLKKKNTVCTDIESFRTKPYFVTNFVDLKLNLSLTFFTNTLQAFLGFRV